MVGYMLCDVGYYVVYFGKWYLSVLMYEIVSLYMVFVVDYNCMICVYGFDDYFGVGDLIGMVCGGYQYDGFMVEVVVSWMCNYVLCFVQDGKLWFFVVNFVNLYDVMFVNIDMYGLMVQDVNYLMFGNVLLLNDVLYCMLWCDVLFVVFWWQLYDEFGWLFVYGMFNVVYVNFVGCYLFIDECVCFYQDNYFNCICDCDMYVVCLLQML